MTTPVLDDASHDPTQVPALLLGFTLDKPGRDPGPNAIRALTDVRRRGHPAGWMAGNRLFNNSEPEQYQLPLRALGYRPVFDYRQDQFGIQAHVHGALQIEGAWYCPHTPPPLIEATADLHNELIEPEDWQHRISARAPYRLVPKQAPDPEGFQRHQCPAAAGRVHCPLKPPLPADHPKRHLLPIVDPAPSPVGPMKICRQDSITIPPEAGAKHAQDLAYGSPTWDRVYHRLGNSVESINGFSKDSVHEDIEAGNLPHPRHRPRFDPPRLPTPPRQHAQARHLGRYPRRRERRAPAPTLHPKTEEQTARHMDAEGPRQRRTPSSLSQLRNDTQYL